MDQTADALDHRDLTEDWIGQDPVPLVLRTLGDGSAHRVVKVFWAPDELVRRLHELGWEISARSTGAFFWAQGGRRRSFFPP